jgi:nicotinate-nucleotide adenylyltransferase
MAISGFGARRRIGIFGGSFNPPHKGHGEIVRWVFQKGLVDEIWVVPCYIHPFGKELAPFTDRMTMARLAFSKLGLPVRVDDVEAQIGGESRTLKTVEHLLDENKDKQFFLVTGSDIEKQTDKWHRFDKIKALVDFIKVPRGPDSPIPNISSTGVREGVAGGGVEWRAMVESEIAIYIVTKALYR